MRPTSECMKPWKECSLEEKADRMDSNVEDFQAEIDELIEQRDRFRTFAKLLRTGVDFEDPPV